ASERCARRWGRVRRATAFFSRALLRVASGGVFWMVALDEARWAIRGLGGIVILLDGLTLRQAEHALAEDVALDLARPGRDRVLARGNQPVQPAGCVGNELRAAIDQRVHAEHLAGGVGDADAELGARELEDRALRPRRLPAVLARERAEARVLHRLAVDVELREPLAHTRIVPRRAAIDRQPARDRDEIANLADRVARAGRVALVHQRGRRDLPAAVERAEELPLRHHDVGEEDLVEMVVAGGED